MSVYRKNYCVSIVVHNPKSRSLPPVQVLSWQNLPWEVRIKWDWYFSYRAALAQVENPRSKVVRRDWSVDAKPIDLLRLKQKELSAAKGQVTKIENLLQKAKDNWNKLFPIEDDLLYKKALIKHQTKLSNYNELLKEVDALKSSL